MPQANPKLRFGNAVVCEDVREEVRAKTTLVGVFSGDIVVPNFPAKIQLAFHIELRDVSAGDTIDLTARIGKREFKLHSTMDDAAGSANIIFPRGIFPFETEGKITITASANGSRQRTILSKKVLKGDVSP